MHCPLSHQHARAPLEGQEKSSLFIVERPLQILNALSIIDQMFSWSNSKIYIAPVFQGAERMASRLQAAFPKVAVCLGPDYHSGFTIAESSAYNELFIHWDVGFGTQRYLRKLKKKNRNININVFEEGIGTYRNDIYPALKRLVFLGIGLPVNVGGSKYVSRIFVYNVSDYKSCAVRRPPIVEKIVSSVEPFFNKYYDEFVAVFDEKDWVSSVNFDAGDECSVFLSGWYFQKEELDVVPPNKSLIIKYHPYCKVTTSVAGWLMAPPEMPAEILILLLSDRFQKVHVYHRGSSVMRYIHRTNVEEIRV